MLSKVDFSAYLNVKNAAAPIYSADGQKVYYLSDVTGTFQVWSVPDSGGWPDQLTFFDERVSGLFIAPTGENLVITRDAGGNEQDQLYRLRGDAEHGVEILPLVEDLTVKHNFVGAWKADGQAIAFSSNKRNPAHFDVYTLDLKEGAEPQLVAQMDATLYPVGWSRSGRYLLIIRYNTNLDTDLYLFDLQVPGSEARHLTPHTGAARYENAVLAPDERGVYLLTDAARDTVALAYLDLQTLVIKSVVGLAWDIDHLQLSPDGTQLVYAINEGGYHHLMIRNVASGVETPINGLPKGITNRLSWARTSDQLILDFWSPTRSFDVWSYDLRQQEIRQITRSPHGGLDVSTFVEPETIHYPSFDGLQIPALWYVPPGAQPNQQTPVIVSVHGGPEGQAQYTWNAPFQYFLQRGYAVLAPNVRGSSGYGKHYLSLDDVRKRPDSIIDLKYAVEWLRSQSTVAPQKIAVMGGSYGGFMVLAALTTFPDLWAAGVDIVGIANLLTFLENTSSYRRHLRASEYGDPERDREFLISISPIHKAERITAPLMVIHGAQDPRVPVGEAEQIVERLRAGQRPVEYQRFEDEGHGIVKLKNRLVCYPRIAAFLDQHLVSDT